MMAFFFIFFSNVQETQRLMQEPDPGISATPDESNARFFHVLVSGPSEVILNFSLKTITMSMIRHVRIKKNQLFMHRSINIDLLNRKKLIRNADQTNFIY